MSFQLKALIRKFPRLHSYLSRAKAAQDRLVNSWKPPRGQIIDLLRRASVRKHEFVFLQIGANTGQDQFSSLRHEYGWSGVMVEPQPKVFAELVKNCGGNPKLAFENAAIAEISGTRELYKLSFTDERWATGLASFERNVVEKHIDNGWVAACAHKSGLQLPMLREDYIATEQVTCLRVEDLLAKHALAQVDLVIIDTEGYDFEIVKLFDAARVRPEIYVLEHKHLARAEYRACVHLLRARGYAVYAEGDDTIALLLSPPRGEGRYGKR